MAGPDCHKTPMMYRVLISLFLASPAIAQDAMSASEFEAYTTGKTLTFAVGEAPYGIERYLPGRRVVWSFLDGRCEDGVWYEVQYDDAPAICFVYEFEPEPQCWRMFAEPGGLRAEFLNDPSESILYEVEESPEEMICQGPDVGV